MFTIEDQYIRDLRGMQCALIYINSLIFSTTEYTVRDSACTTDHSMMH
jgi:hypothetical protein